MKISHNLEQITSKIKSIFSQGSIDKLAYESGFIRRSTNKINPLNFIILMTLSMSMNSLYSLEGMSDILAGLKGGIKISAQALSQRINGINAARFLRRCLSAILTDKLADPVTSLSRKGLLSTFNRVLLEDSTSCELNENLSSFYKGCGGCSYKAGYKINLVWDALSGSIKHLTVTGSHKSDQSFCNDIISSLEKTDLVIRDLGYFSIPIFSEIHSREAYFLSRLKRGGMYL
jgi:Transposase DDE domain